MSGVTVDTARPNAYRREPRLAGRTPGRGFATVLAKTLPLDRDRIAQYGRLRSRVASSPTSCRPAPIAARDSRVRRMFLGGAMLKPHRR